MGVVFLLAGMGLQFPAGSITLSIGVDGRPEMKADLPLIRMDLWSTWLEIGCAHAEKARAANERLSPGLVNDEKFAILTEELQAGLVALTAFAFAIDGFYDTVKAEMGPHPHEAVWKEKGKARYSQVAETFRFHMKLSNEAMKGLHAFVKQLMSFRDRAVHPTSKYVEPNYRPQVDSGVHPNLITFSGPHAVQSRAFTLEALTHLVKRATELAPANADRGWLERASTELARLSQTYRTAGDDAMAFPVAGSGAED